MIKVGSDFSGVGAFDQAVIRLGFDYKTVFACDMDKYARQTFIANYGEPGYYPENVYDREIPKESLDIYMTSPPCQSFSLAGKRGGEDDKRGTLFYNSHEFIKVNKPKYFIFENVKGLLSDDGGKTFRRWLDYLGGKSVNGTTMMFPHEESVPYHVYHKVLNAKHYGVPQNRERIFIIGIRDDRDNNFHFPKPQHLTKKLKDVLESDVDKKYYLSDSAINSIILNDNVLQKSTVDPEIGNSSQSPGNACGNYKGMNAISVKSASKQGCEIATEGDSINYSQPNSKTRRGRVGKEVAQTLETSCNQGVMIAHKYEKEIRQSLNQDYATRIDGSYYKGFGVRQGKCRQVVESEHKIRRLTPRECFRLMDFPDTFKMVCSDTQMYKQAGNSIVVAVLCEIIKKLNLSEEKND